MLGVDISSNIGFTGLFNGFSAVVRAEEITIVSCVVYDKDGNKGTLQITNPKSFTSGTTKLSSGFYYADSDVTVKNRVEVENGADARIILKDGGTLTCEKGIGVTAGGSLTVYGQE